ncbi:MAG: Aromatic hydrocarbon utilization transcriptional regulator CatR [Firmicutes bacterium]|nr:Aromatic hydrocarbon utilization transcriptional regulator CatR [Bacillota bacterium]
MEIRQLRYFETVAKLGNLTKAAAVLNISQPPLSQQIKVLEKELGVKLFERHKHGMFLTNEGYLLLEQIRPLLQQFQGLKSYISGIDPHEAISTLTIATHTGLAGMLSNALFHYWHKAPNVRIAIREGIAEMVLNCIKNAQAQIGITRLPVMNDQINYTVLGHDPIRAFLRDDDPLASKEIILPEDLKNRLLLLIQTNMPRSGFSRIFQVLEDAGTRPKVFCYAETGATILQFVKRGMGIALIPGSNSIYMPPGIYSRPFAKSTISIPTAVVWRKDENNPIVIEAKNAIIQHCKEDQFISY